MAGEIYLKGPSATYTSDQYPLYFRDSGHTERRVSAGSYTSPPSGYPSLSVGELRIANGHLYWRSYGGRYHVSNNEGSVSNQHSVPYGAIYISGAYLFFRPSGSSTVRRVALG